ncbi:MAG: hypothetical protein V7K48_23165 [Nostoc sp.]|uniref:hypothetical protein n=1 Tax=Nostoc sp. TaxID=1180 RepID=UPI002FF49887
MDNSNDSPLQQAKRDETLLCVAVAIVFNCHPSGSAVRNRRKPPELRLPHRISIKYCWDIVCKDSN